jgi:hypothetical protein
VASSAEHNAVQPVHGSAFVSKAISAGLHKTARPTEVAGFVSKLNGVTSTDRPGGTPDVPRSNPSNNSKLGQTGMANHFLAIDTRAPSAPFEMKRSLKPKVRKPMGHGCGYRKK